MFTTLRNAWKIPELRKKILFTLIVMLIYRLGNCVPVPYVNVVALNNYFTTQLANTVLGLYNAIVKLEENPQKWAEEVLKYEKYERKNTKEEIVKANFDIKANAKYLQEFYLNKC